MQPRMTKVNLCVKEPQDYIKKYHFSSFKVNTTVNFPSQITGEVRHLSKKQKKEYKKIVKSFMVTTLSFLTLSSRSMANELSSTPNQSITTSLPSELIEPIMEIIKMALGGSILLSVLLLISAGVMRQFRKKKEAIEWTNDIIRGFLQILIAVPLVFLLYYIVTKLLGNFSQFLSPF